ncbi:MAG TPA: lysophospholipid acyltransferase family protein [Thermoanaerobaculia bacterium]|nr:lysophospholipid acyltransferase family protein [Thermoanaerobaculia bacterium]
MQRLEYSLFSFLVWSSQRVSRRTRERSASGIGQIAHRLLSKRTSLARSNLAAVFPSLSEAEREGILQRSWNHFASAILSYLGTVHRPLEEIAAETDVEGWDHVEAALALGRGMILVSGHFGNWEAALSVLTRSKRPVIVVARKLDNKLLERDLERGRSRAGFVVVDRKGAGREMVRGLTTNCVVIILIDQAPKPREGVRLRFLGRPAWTTPTPAKLALRYHSPIVFAFSYPGNPERLEFTAPLNVDDLPADQQTVEVIMQRLNDELEERVRRDPHLWLWQHDRWKGIVEPPSPEPPA